MSSVNKVILVGRVGQDVVVRYAASGDAVCSLSLATSERWKDKSSGVSKEQTEWHNIVMYKKLAEIAGKYVKKGDQIYVEGSLHTRKLTDKNGVERYTTEIKAHSMTMLGGVKQQGGSKNQDADLYENNDF